MLTKHIHWGWKSSRFLTSIPQVGMGLRNSCLGCMACWPQDSSSFFVHLPSQHTASPHSHHLCISHPQACEWQDGWEEGKGHKKVAFLPLLHHSGLFPNSQFHAFSLKAPLPLGPTWVSLWGLHLCPRLSVLSFYDDEVPRKI